MSTNQPVKERFESNFVKSAGCWNWQSGLAHNGYGRFKINYMSVKAHRFAYELYLGPIPDGLLVMHMCDNRQCVNPDHLTVGDQKENVRDCVVKGRRGKLQPADIPEIRKLIGAKVPISDIAAQYKVDRDTISAIGSGKAWSSIV